MNPTPRRFSTVKLVFALLLLFCVAPFVQDLRHGDLLISGLIVLALIAAVLCTGGQRWTLAVSGWLAVQLLATRTIHYLHPEWLPEWFTFTTALGFCVFV